MDINDLPILTKFDSKEKIFTEYSKAFPKVINMYAIDVQFLPDNDPRCRFAKEQMVNDIYRRLER